ncbi:MAG: IreB family regulatory phosphoprotein [Oscillospiraceae bacterium]|nr:IreB family regulatory phosphoprotein [Oscillospiraceae bacterium]
MYVVMDDFTRKFDVVPNQEDTKAILKQVYESLRLKGYNPVNQIVGYILSEDPTYITNYNNARSLICRLDRDELLREMVINYLEE